MVDYKHIRCQCGGIIGMYNRETFNCEQCDNEYKIYKLNYDACLTNDKTGWIFPVIYKEDKQHETIF